MSTTDPPTKITDEMMKAVASYTGPVTICEPGEAQGRPVRRKRTAQQKLAERASKWLYRHRFDQPQETKEQRKHRIRIERFERERREKIARRNRRILKARGL